MGPVKSYLNEHNVTAFPVQPSVIATLIDMIDKGELNFFGRIAEDTSRAARKSKRKPGANR